MIRPCKDETIPLLDRTASVVVEENIWIGMGYFVAVSVDMSNNGCSWFKLLNEGKYGFSMVLIDGEDHPQPHVEGSMHFQIRDTSLTLEP